MIRLAVLTQVMYLARHPGGVGQGFVLEALAFWLVLPGSARGADSRIRLSMTGIQRATLSALFCSIKPHA